MDDNWIQTYTGKKFWPLNPRVEDVDIVDIAHSLSLKCRFTGHSLRFYSVAEHCINVRGLVRMEDNPGPQVLEWALLHDAAEAYLPDVAAPIKRTDEFAFFRVAEERLLTVIANRFGLYLPIPSVVEEADHLMLDIERKQVMTEGPAWTRSSAKEGHLDIQFWEPMVAERKFSRRFYDLF